MQIKSVIIHSVRLKGWLQVVVNSNFLIVLKIETIAEHAPATHMKTHRTSARMAVI